MARNISRRTKCLTVLSIGVLILSAVCWNIAPLKAIVEPFKGIVEPNISVKQTKATAYDKKRNRELAEAYAYAGWGWQETEWLCIDALWTSESRFDNFAKNQRGSTAYGIAQRLGETSSDPSIQILKGYRYIAKRYHTPCNAYRFWLNSTPHHY
jgi:hypothetical protein